MKDEWDLAEGEEGYPTGPAPDGQEGKSNKQPPGGAEELHLMKINRRKAPGSLQGRWLPLQKLLLNQL